MMPVPAGFRLIETEQQLVLEPERPAQAVVIWLHGLGADGHDFVPVVPYLKLSDALSVRFIFPRAPVQPVTVNNGWEMRAWYDILSMGASREINEQTLFVSAARISTLIDQQCAEGIAAQKIILIGFSQGGAVAYEAGLGYPQQLGGIAALSTYLATDPASRLRCAADFPLWIAHGTADDVVPLNLGEQARDRLQLLGLKPQWHTWPMAHEVVPEQIQALGQWLDNRLQ
ncbi:MAG: alpha/beta hydrolase [Marinobacterium sp.]|nr:alpha/beta hydrolase [Marinobacterium sp.]